MTNTQTERLTGGRLIPFGEVDPNARLAGLRLLAKLLDSAIPIPGTKIRIGLDPIIDIIPGIGDAIGAAVGSYIILSAAQLGVPRVVLARMLMNVGVDALVGAAPFVGPILDATYRSNTRNIALLEKAMAEPKATRRASAWTVLGLVAAVVGIVAGGVVLSVALIRVVWNALA